MIHKILVAADGPDAWQAVAATLELADSSGEVEVEVVHVNEVEYQTPAKGPDEADIGAGARVLVDELVDELVLHGVTAFGRVRPGVYDDVADDIVAEAQEFEADLIVVGCRPRSDLSCWIKGSVSHAVLRRAACPVVVVRETSVRA